ncbi:stage II sporulation protein P [Rossellomorea aquimaris]|uniref:stage II sporulation protein P n=1 Tax=Rossellomorea aquimaris TaxID=189382 RepID=UPI001CD5ED3C|nr:stage II sporulation protein P [Rossellomorea aquimaris]MCA1058863.1 stage II sporulation protein P [Rossellomorea aquimaris]
MMSYKSRNNNSLVPLVFVSMKAVIRIVLIGIILMYLMVWLISSTAIKLRVDSIFYTSVSELVPKETFLMLLSQEMTGLRIENKEAMNNDFDWLESVTNVSLLDPRSLFGREIPGIENYHTHIAVAGKGTDITNLPNESPAPTEDQLKDQEIDQSQIDEANHDSGNGVQEIENKSVFIYHSHSWEAFSPLIKNNDSKDPASTNEKVNVIAVGSKLKQELESRGIGVVHDKTDVNQALKNKSWTYFESYKLSRGLVQEAIAQDDNLNYLIDIHRDSMPRDITTKAINGKSYARLFFIVGKENKNYEKNLKIAKELNAKLEEKYPGISRGVFVKTRAEGNGVYNQDLTEQAMLLEFGGVENNLVELYNSTEAFAEIFASYYKKDAVEVNAQ